MPLVATANDVADEECERDRILHALTAGFSFPKLRAMVPNMKALAAGGDAISNRMLVRSCMMSFNFQCKKFEKCKLVEAGPSVVRSYVTLRSLRRKTQRQLNFDVAPEGIL